MIDISASYHYEPDYEDVLAMPTLPIYYDEEYSTAVRNYRFTIRLQRWQREEYKRVRANTALYRRLRKQHLDTLAYLRATLATFGDPGADLHRKMYLDALHRAESAASEKTPFS